MSACIPDGSSGSRWPATSRCGPHGTCVPLIPYTDPSVYNPNPVVITEYFCQCDSGWSSSGDFIFSPYQSCHINQKILFAMWFLALGGLLFVAAVYIKVCRAFLHAYITNTNKRSSNYDPDAPPTNDRVRSKKSLSRRMRSFWKQFAAFSEHPTRRCLVAIFFMTLFFGILCIIKLINIGMHISDGGLGSVDAEATLLVGVEPGTTIIYCLASLMYLLLSAISSLVWAESAKAFYSKLEGEQMRASVVKELYLGSCFYVATYIVPGVIAILAHHTSMNVIDVFSVYEMIVALHFQLKGLIPLVAWIVDDRVARKFIANMQKHQLLQQALAEKSKKLMPALGSTATAHGGSGHNLVTSMKINVNAEAEEDVELISPANKNTTTTTNAGRNSTGLSMNKEVRLAIFTSMTNGHGTTQHEQPPSPVLQSEHTSPVASPLMFPGTPNRTPPRVESPSFNGAMPPPLHPVTHGRGSNELLHVHAAHGGPLSARSSLSQPSSRRNSLHQHSPMPTVTHSGIITVPSKLPIFEAKKARRNSGSLRRMTNETSIPTHNVIIHTAAAAASSSSSSSASTLTMVETMSPVSPDPAASPAVSPSKPDLPGQSSLSVIELEAGLLRQTSAPSATGSDTHDDVLPALTTPARSASPNNVGIIKPAVIRPAANRGVVKAVNHLQPTHSRRNSEGASVTAGLNASRVAAQTHTRNRSVSPVPTSTLSALNGGNGSSMAGGGSSGTEGRSGGASTPALANVVVAVKSQAEMQAEQREKLADFSKRLGDHTARHRTILIAYLTINTVFAWTPLLRSFIPYLLPIQVLATVLSVRSFLFALTRDEKQHSAATVAPAPTHSEQSTMSGGADSVMIRSQGSGHGRGAAQLSKARSERIASDVKRSATPNP